MYISIQFAYNIDHVQFQIKSILTILKWIWFSTLIAPMGALTLMMHNHTNIIDNEHEIQRSKCETHCEAPTQHFQSPMSEHSRIKRPSSLINHRSRIAAFLCANYSSCFTSSLTSSSSSVRSTITPWSPTPSPGIPSGKAARSISSDTPASLSLGT